MSFKLAKPLSAIWAALMTSMAIGTFCTFSTRFCAVTTISASGSCPLGADLGQSARTDKFCRTYVRLRASGWRTLTTVGHLTLPTARAGLLGPPFPAFGQGARMAVLEDPGASGRPPSLLGVFP